MNVLIPLKTPSYLRFHRFKSCFNSYYRHLKNLKDVEYIICDETREKADYDRNCEFLNTFDINKRYIKNDGVNFYDAISSLIRSVNQEYFLFLVDDVVTSSVNIFPSLLKAFELIPNLIQVKMGGGTVLFHNRFHQKERNFNNITINNDTIWFNNTNKVMPVEDYIFGYWNSIMKSDFFVNYNKIISKEKYNNKAKTFHDYAHVASFLGLNNVDIVNTQTGWINFKSYLCPYDQTSPESWFLKE